MNELKEAQLTADIMRRVRFIHGLRLLLSPSMIRAIVLLVSIGSTAALVSVPHVLANMSHLAVNAYASYLAHAYIHTSMAVQAVVMLALAAGSWFVADMIKNVRFARNRSGFRQA
jgi:hypothetical protein